MSRTSVVIEVAESLPIGSLVRLSIDWPAKLENNINLTVNVQGRTLHAQGLNTIVQILRYEFRIRPALHLQLHA